jgi:hypothetical protein
MVMDEWVLIVISAGCDSFLQNYETYRDLRLKGVDESADRELDADVVIPAVDIETPLNPFLIKPWVKVQDQHWGAYFYNMETGGRGVGGPALHA